MGGHLLDLAVENTPVTLDVTPRFLMVFPQSGDFAEMDFSEDTSQELAELEQ